jgi:cyclopropane-fatty-acyl-phospholipid synthase
MRATWMRLPHKSGGAVLKGLLRRLIKIGRLTVIEVDGSVLTCGEPAADQPDVVVRLTKRFTPLKLALWPDLYLGEAYTAGDLVIERGSLWDLLDLCGRNLEREPRRGSGPLLRLVKAVARQLQQFSPAQLSQKNVAHHYDLPHELYQTFLDPDLQYSCAYFSDAATSLEEAQRAKKRHILSKLLLEPGHRVLDIGCGWGGLALALAQAEHVFVHGITLSQQQLAIARQRAKDAGLESRVTFELRDYRSVKGKFDRIVSVGMFEHVGTPHYRTFFKAVSDLLLDDGIALIHSIGRMSGPDVTSAWIRKYIFPGGYIPAMSQVSPAIEHAGLWLTDLEILRLNYAETLRAWRERFLAHVEQVAEMYDKRFCRMWEFYLAVSEMSFRYGGMMVFQAQLAAKIDSVPITRDYMFEPARRRAELTAAE